MISKPRNILVCSVFAGLAAASLQAQTTMTHSMPVSLRPGETTRVTFHGKGLAAARGLWTSFPADCVLATDPPPNDNAVSFDVTIAEDQPLGLAGWRIVTDGEITDVRLCVVDDLPLVMKAGGNQAPEAAQALTPPVAVNGAIGAEQRDFYAIEVQEGQRLAFEVIGDRLGSGFDPLLQIWSADAKELIASYDNDEGIGFDLRTSHLFEEPGRYLIELRDTRYQGGGHWTYHLRIGDFPVARVAFPAGVQRGGFASIAFPGKTASDVPPMNISAPENPLHDIHSLPIRGADASVWVPIALDDREQQLELEPNDEPAIGNALAIGRAINGRLEKPEDVDCYRFQAKKGSQVFIRGDARRLSSPADLYMTVLNAAGNQLAAIDDTGAAEGEMTFQVPDDGTYVLTVEDLHRRGGPEYVYRVETSLGRQDYSLAMGADRIVVPKGSATPIAATLARAGFAGPVDVEATLIVPGQPSEETPSGLTVSTASIPQGSTGGAATVAATLDAPVGHYTLQFLARDKDSHLRRGGDVAAIVSPQLNNLLSLPSSVVRQVPVLVTERAFFTVETQLGADYVGRYVSTPLTITAGKEKFFDEEIALTVANLPANVQLEAKPIPKGEKSITLQIASQPRSALGSFPVFVSGTATFQGRKATVFSETLMLEIRPAFALTPASETVKISPGMKTTLKVTVARHPGYAGPVEIALKNLPQGTTASPAKIEESQNEAEIELSAAADAPTGDAANVIVEGKATVGGQAETATSGAFSISVQSETRTE